MTLISLVSLVSIGTAVVGVMADSVLTVARGYDWS